MEFTANYNPTDYDAVVNAIASTGENAYQLEFGSNGAQGKFQWNGNHSVRVSGADVNGVREMVITVIPSTAITKASS